jgi:hypothetical protein
VAQVVERLPRKSSNPSTAKKKETKEKKKLFAGP